jgi:drug/metabolite transporter (DMT)-like permease
LAAIGQAAGAVLSRKGYVVMQASGETIDGATAAYQRIFGGIGVAVLFFLWMCWRGDKMTTPVPWRKASRWVVINALSGPVIGVACFQWALSAAPSGVVLAIVATQPIAVIPLSYFLEGDKPSARSLIGGSVAVAGVVALMLAR